MKQETGCRAQDAGRETAEGIGGESAGENTEQDQKR